MDDREVGRMWDANAEVWTKLARAGYDVYRDRVNTPAFLAVLPNVNGLRGLDIGCGEGHNTRLLAKRGARMTAMDISETFIRQAQQAESESPLTIRYQLASAHRLPFADETFDFATSFMCLMDMPEPERAIREAFRVIKPGGFFQFSITHPCFQTPLWNWVRDENGNKLGVICGEYFDHVDGKVDEWIFGAAPAEVKQPLRKFRIPRFDRTLSEWLNALLDTGFQIERLTEPRADEKTAEDCPAVGRHAQGCLLPYCSLPKSRLEPLIRARDRDKNPEEGFEVNVDPTAKSAVFMNSVVGRDATVVWGIAPLPGTPTPRRDTYTTGIAPYNGLLITRAVHE